jgi:hypothetical protein
MGDEQGEELARLGEGGADRIPAGTGGLDQAARQPPARQEFLLGDRQAGERPLEPLGREGIGRSAFDERPDEPDGHRAADEEGERQGL